MSHSNPRLRPRQLSDRGAREYFASRLRPAARCLLSLRTNILARALITLWAFTGCSSPATTPQMSCAQGLGAAGMCETGQVRSTCTCSGGTNCSCDATRSRTESSAHNNNQNAGVMAETPSVAGAGVGDTSDAGRVNAPIIGAGASGGASGGASAGATAPSIDELTSDPIDDATYVFDQSQLRTYNIIVAPSDLATIDAQPSAEMYIPASLEFEGKSYGPYRMRYKGASGAWDPPCTSGGASTPTPKSGKCSIKIDFDVNNNATFHGLKKLNFHALNQDPTMLRERLAYGLFREMGIASSRVAHARVLINGNLEGLFAAVEQVDGRFTRARFGEGGLGNLYKEVWPMHSDASVYIPALETNTKQPNVQRMLDFKSAIDEGMEAFGRFVDRDYLLRYLAVDRVIANDDGMLHFWCRANGQGNNPGAYGNHNYYWYEAEKVDRMWLIPWDLDFALGARQDVKILPEWSQEAPCVCGYPAYGIQRPARCDAVVGYMSDWLSDYEREVDDFIAGPFQADRVNAKLDAWAEQIRDSVTEASGIHGAPTASVWLAAISLFKSELDNERRLRGHAF
jgi:spore coat protein H